MAKKHVWALPPVIQQKSANRMAAKVMKNSSCHKSYVTRHTSHVTRHLQKLHEQCAASSEDHSLNAGLRRRR